MGGWGLEGWGADLVHFLPIRSNVFSQISQKSKGKKGSGHDRRLDLQCVLGREEKNPEKKEKRLRCLRLCLFKKPCVNTFVNATFFCFSVVYMMHLQNLR